MTVAAVTRRVQYTVGGSGQAGPYAFTFTVLDEGDLAVYQGSTTSSTLKTLTTHYTVALSADGTGSITFVGGQEPTTAQLITIIGDRAISRTTDFTAGGDIRASTMNLDLDALTVQQQQLDEAMDRAVQVEIRPPLPTLRYTGKQQEQDLGLRCDRRCPDDISVNR